MKYLVFMLIVLSPLAIGSDPHAEPDKPLYQNVVPGVPTGSGKRLGGVWRRVRPAKPETMAEFKERLKKERLLWQQKKDARQSSLGGWIKIAGLSLFVLAALCHFSTSLPIARSWASSILTLGVGVYVLGWLVQMDAKYGKWIEIVIAITVVLIVVAILYVNRDKSLSHWKFFKKKG